VSEIYITAYLIFAVFFVTDKNDCGHTPVANQLLTLGKRSKERAVIDLAACVREGLRLIRLFVFLGLSNRSFSFEELISCQNLSFAVVTDFNQLPSKFLVLKIEKILVRHMSI
jgi:hypothetical protein